MCDISGLKVSNITSFSDLLKHESTRAMCFKMSLNICIHVYVRSATFGEDAADADDDMLIFPRPHKQH